MGKAIETRQDAQLARAERLGQAANRAAARHAFAEYMSRRAENTVRRQAGDLARFADFLATVEMDAGDLQHDLDGWRSITWGLVDAFVKWMLNAGDAIGAVNVRLSTVKTYARLAVKAGALAEPEYAMIRLVAGYRQSEARRIDEQRPQTRRGSKKPQPVAITPAQARMLKTQPDDTPQGRRDALMMELMLNLGLRVGEVAGMVIEGFDLRAGTVRLYRPKVDKMQTHDLINGTWDAARAYLKDCPKEGRLMRGSVRGGQLAGDVMSVRGITKRVRILGERVGLRGLSAHDCRHYWATQAAKDTPLDRLQDAGGWSSYAMPLRYIESAKIANQGVQLAE